VSVFTSERYVYDKTKQDKHTDGPSKLARGKFFIRKQNEREEEGEEEAETFYSIPKNSRTYLTSCPLSTGN